MQEHFLRDEKEQQLEFSPSEARNPLTMHLDDDFRASTRRGTQTLQACDKALTGHFREILASQQFMLLVSVMQTARKIVFSGGGSIGRLALLLECAWNEAHPDDHRVFSLMTGDDFALLKAVESFEDYQQIGARQAQNLTNDSRDLLIGITATGETTSIIDSAIWAARQGVAVFMLICVPVESTWRLERCPHLYFLPNVTAISMPIGLMAVTGFTRMHSGTIACSVTAAALEMAFDNPTCDNADAYEQMLQGLVSPESLDSLVKIIDFSMMSIAS